MKHADLISGIFLLMVGLLLSVGSFSYPIGRITNPGIGFFPFILGLLLILLSLMLLGRSRSSSLCQERASPPFLSGGWKKGAYTISVLLLATFLFETMGYLLTLFFLMVSLMFGAEFKGLKKIVFIALLVTGSVYLVFVLLLKQPLPQGFLRM